MSTDSAIDLDENVFTTAAPKREWLVRCENSDNSPDVCAITVNRGEIEFNGPEDGLFNLVAGDIVEFRDAFVAALQQATADIRGRH